MAQEPSQNIGVADAYLRLWGGLTLLALGAGRKFGRVGSLLAVLLGASKVAEGITRYCPIYDMMDLTSLDGKLRRRERETTPEATPLASFVRRTFPWENRHGENDPDGRGPATTSHAMISEPVERPDASRSRAGLKPVAEKPLAGTVAARPTRRARPAVKLVGKRASERKKTTPETNSGVATKSTGIAPDDNPRPITERRE